MLRLSVLGGVALGGTDAAESVMAQPKRLALLAYLAAATPHGPHSRDTLLGLFWPESDHERARNALNVALYSLRRALGEEVVVSRGREQLGLDRERLWCDAVAFEDALDAGRLEAALELYRGELLTGFFLSGAPEFERWVDRERARIERRAVEAARVLAERAEAAGDLAAAAHWARRLLGLAPGNEQALRRLIALLDRMGDRTGAIRAYETFAQELQDELALEPTPETRTLIDAVRSGATARERPDAGLATELAGTAEPAAPAAERPDSALSDLVPSDADSGGAPPAVRPPGRRRSPARAALLGVIGSLRDPHGRWRPRALAALLGFILVVVLGTGTALWRGSSDATPAASAAAQGFRTGELALRAGRYTAAVRAFQRAVRADSTSARAYYGLSKAANWTAEPGLSRWAAEQALRYAERVPGHVRLRIEAWHAYLVGEPVRAERLYRVVLDEDPDDADAWFYLAEVQYHWLPSLGHPAIESRASWQRVLALEPQNAGALIHLARIAAIEGRRATFDSLAARITRFAPDIAQAVELRLLDAFAFGDRAARERAAHGLVNLEGRSRTGAVLTTVAHSNDLAGAPELLIPWIIPTAENPGGRILEYLLWAGLEAARGRIAAAEQVLDTVATFHPALALEYRGMIATLGFLPLEPGRREGVRSALAGPPPPNAGYVRSLPWQAYLLGLMDARTGQISAARRAAAEIERFRGNAIDSHYAHGFARQIHAEIARAEGRLHDALAALGEPRLRPNDLLPTVLSYPTAHERWLRAELLHELGRDEEALRWYATFPDPQGYDLIYLAPSHLRRAEIHERLGETEQAAEHYARFLALWNDADPELQPRLREVERRLERLRLEPRGGRGG